MGHHATPVNRLPVHSSERRPGPVSGRAPRAAVGRGPAIGTVPAPGSRTWRPCPRPSGARRRLAYGSHRRRGRERERTERRLDTAEATRPAHGLPGVGQTEAILADAVPLSAETWVAAYDQQLRGAAARTIPRGCRDPRRPPVDPLFGVLGRPRSSSSAQPGARARGPRPAPRERPLSCARARPETRARAGALATSPGQPSQEGGCTRDGWDKPTRFPQAHGGGWCGSRRTNGHAGRSRGSGSARASGWRCCR
jgi:hypothetical protein